MSAWVLARKDLVVYFRDRAGVLVGLGVPVVLATVFGVVFGALNSGGQPTPRARLSVEDRDGTAASRALLADLEGAKGLRVTRIDPADVDPGGEGSARARVASGDVPAGLLIPAGYAASLAAGEDPGLVLFRDPAKTVEQQIVAGNLMPVLMGQGGEAFGRRLTNRSLELLDFPVAGRAEAQGYLQDAYDRVVELVDRLEREEPSDGGVPLVLGEETPAAEAAGPGAGDVLAADPDSDDDGGFDFASGMTEFLGLEVEDVVGGSDAKRANKLAVQAHSVSGIAVMMLLFGIVACGSTILEEEERGTLDRLRLAPSAPILGGKFLYAWAIGMIQLLVLFVYGSIVFQLPIFRAPAALLVHSAAVAAAAVGFGVLFAVVCRSRKQLDGLSTIVILSMSALGGSWFPLVMAPEWVQKLAHVTITAWAMDGYNGIFWYEKGLLDLLPEIGVLTGFALVTGLVARKVWSRRLVVA